jgi:hypothetical protein
MGQKINLSPFFLANHRVCLDTIHCLSSAPFCSGGWNGILAMDAAAVRLHSDKDQNPNKPWSVPYYFVWLDRRLCSRLMSTATKAGSGLAMAMTPLSSLP